MSEQIDDRKLDLFIATETWHNRAEDLSLKQVILSDFLVDEVSREHRKGGGVAVFY